VDIPRSTLIDWCGQATAALQPLAERIRAEVFRTDRLHVDDTPVRVLDPKVRQTRGKERGVKEGRIWTYVRDDRPWNGPDPPVVAYFFSPDRKGEHPRAHLEGFTGILQADAYSGFAKLYEALPGMTPRIREAACRVGGVVTDPAPHRPGRADFPHPVPRARASLTARRSGGRSWGVGGDVARAWRGSATRTACCAARAA
ncbi:MAG: transposase, partial [Gammaproteobacteria bacterium]|nr:transposase [Gammaproteobacteria bacterium]